MTARCERLTKPSVIAVGKLLRALKCCLETLGELG